MPLCRPELVPEVKRAYEQLGGWMKPGQLPLVYHTVYNIGTSTYGALVVLSGVLLVRMLHAADLADRILAGRALSMLSCV